MSNVMTNLPQNNNKPIAIHANPPLDDNNRHKANNVNSRSVVISAGCGIGLKKYGHSLFCACSVYRSLLVFLMSVLKMGVGQTPPRTKGCYLRMSVHEKFTEL